MVEKFLDELYNKLIEMENTVDALDIEIAMEEDEITALIKTTQQQTVELIKDELLELFINNGLLRPITDDFDEEIE